MKLEALRLDKSAKDALVVLKRKTGVETWNVLCRWALCVSLANKDKSSSVVIGEKKEIEIAWEVFAGKAASVFKGLLIERCRAEGLEVNKKNLNQLLSLHVHRGIGYLMADKSIKTISDLVRLAA